MANKNLFTSKPGKIVPETNTINDAGGKAYLFPPKHQLAQFVFTGCLTDTYYAKSEDQLTKIIDLCNTLSPEFIAKVAVAGREAGYMKDTPALLLAVLCARGEIKLVSSIFNRVIDNGKMLRNFVQIVRSGATGRKSFGTAIKKLIQNWLTEKGPEGVFCITGNDPSIIDILKMVHPKPTNDMVSNAYSYILGKKFNFDLLPDKLKAWELFKKDQTNPLPNIPWEMISSYPDLSKENWVNLANRMSFTQTRMNLNSLKKHGVFDFKAGIDAVCKSLSKIPQGVLPYQLLTTYRNIDNDIPTAVKIGIQNALDASVNNIPDYGRNLYLFLDTSSSMMSPVTGDRGSATTATSCFDVAKMFAIALYKKNPTTTKIVQFSSVTQYENNLNPHDSIVTNCENIQFLGGATDCSLPMKELLQQIKQDGYTSEHPPVIIYLSDNESWIEQRLSVRGTYTMNYFRQLQKLVPGVKLVCVDLCPNATSQAQNEDDILNVGGFSDFVFTIINNFIQYGKKGSWFVDKIEQTVL